LRKRDLHTYMNKSPRVSLRTRSTLGPNEPAPVHLLQIYFYVCNRALHLRKRDLHTYMNKGPRFMEKRPTAVFQMIGLEAEGVL